MNSGRSGKTIIPDTVGGLDQMLDAVVGTTPDPVASQAFLLVLSGTDPGRLHVLERPEMVIGRSRFADIHISERALSQQHCKITRHAEHHRLFDLGSTNGTFVNDMRIQQADLKPGDVIRTGETIFTYMSGSHGTAASPAPMHASPVARPFAAAQPATSTALVRTQRAPPRPPPATALARRPAQPLITLAEGGYAGAPQVLEISTPGAAPEAPDLLARILWAIGFLRRYWLSITLLTIIGGGIGVGSYKFFKPSAKAEFEISLQAQASDNPAERMRRTNFEFFRSAQKNFTRPALIYETLKELGETDVTPNYIRGVQARIEFKKAGEFAYSGAYEAATPEEAVAFLDVHLNLYKEYEIEKTLKVLIAEVDTLESQLNQAAEQLTSTTQAILAFKTENSDGLPEKSSFLFGRSLELGVQRGTAQGNVTRAAAQVQVARKALRSEAPLIQARIAESQPYSANIADVSSRLAEARAQGKGPEHPDIKRMEEEKRSFEALRDKVLREGTSRVIKSKNPAYHSARLQLDSAEAALRVAQSDLARINSESEEVEGVVGKLPRLQAEYADLVRNETAVQRQYNDLFQQLNGTRVRLDLEHAQAETRYEVLTPPNVAPVSKMKTIFMRAGIGTFLGMFFGIGLGVLRELRRYLAVRLAAARR